jgi:hypothetical protein
MVLANDAIVENALFNGNQPHFISRSRFGEDGTPDFVEDEALALPCGDGPLTKGPVMLQLPHLRRSA